MIHVPAEAAGLLGRARDAPGDRRRPRAHPPDPPLTLGRHTPAPGRPRPLVLLVEDDADVRRAFHALLAQAGMDVIEAGDVQDGVAQARAQLPDLVLLDVQLPGPNGWNAARAIKEDPVMHRMAVVAVTGLGGESDRDASYAAGCDYHLTKPVSPQVLLSTVRAILHERGVSTQG